MSAMLCRAGLMQVAIRTALQASCRQPSAVKLGAANFEALARLYNPELQLVSCQSSPCMSSLETGNSKDSAEVKSQQ